MARMSKTNAAYEILKEYNRPMSYKRIIDIAIKQNLIITKGKTPDQTLRVDINNEIKRKNKNNKPQRFIIYEGGYVSLVKDKK